MPQQTDVQNNPAELPVSPHERNIWERRSRILMYVFGLSVLSFPIALKMTPFGKPKTSHHVTTEKPPASNQNQRPAYFPPVGQPKPTLSFEDALNEALVVQILERCQDDGFTLPPCGYWEDSDQHYGTNLIVLDCLDGFVNDEVCPDDTEDQSSKTSNGNSFSNLNNADLALIEAEYSKDVCFDDQNNVAILPSPCDQGPPYERHDLEEKG